MGMTKVHWTNHISPIHTKQKSKCQRLISGHESSQCTCTSIHFTATLKNSTLQKTNKVKFQFLFSLQARPVSPAHSLYVSCSLDLSLNFTWNGTCTLALTCMTGIVQCCTARKKSHVPETEKCQWLVKADSKWKIYHTVFANTLKLSKDWIRSFQWLKISSGAQRPPSKCWSTLTSKHSQNLFLKPMC